MDNSLKPHDLKLLKDFSIGAMKSEACFPSLIKLSSGTSEPQRGPRS